MWNAFVFAWESFAIYATIKSGGAAIVMPLFGLLFVAVGLFLIKQMWVIVPRARANHRYAITDRRVLFVGGYPEISVRELPFTPYLRVQYTFNDQDRGTIRFWDPSVGSAEGEMVVTSSNGRHAINAPYSFEGIDAVTDVVRILETQRNLLARAA